MANKGQKKVKAALKARKRKPGPKRPKTKAGAHKQQPASKLVKQVCSVTDPFCVGAIGSKWPDSTSSRTFAFQNRQYLSHMNDANGRAAIAISPSGYYTSATWATAETVATWSTLTQWTGILGFNTAKFRVVSLGVTVKSIASSMENGGTLTVVEVASKSATDDITTFNINSLNHGQILKQGLNVTTAVSGVMRGDATLSKEFNSFQAGGTLASAVNNNGNAIIVVAVDGAVASKSILLIEVVANFEVAFDTDTVLSQFATPAAPDNSLVRAASNHVSVAVPAVVAGSTDQYAEVVHKHAARALDSALSLAGDYVGTMLMGLLL